ncbi:MAG: hypothetical protein J2P17_24515 [Mycobacterium sp.]|nr:hypothetical protein [Mycobacterium sp.]
MRSRIQTITPTKAAEMLQANTSNRPLSKRVVQTFAEAMKRGEWKITHQGVAVDTNGTLVDGQHRLAAVIEANLPVEMTVFTDVPPDTFDVLDTGKRRNAADVLAIEGEQSTHHLAAMLRTVWLYDNRRDMNWSGGGASVSNQQILETLEANPSIREYVAVGDRLASEVGMIKSAGGAVSYLVARVNSQKKLQPWLDGVIDGAGLEKGDARLRFRNHMLGLARREAGEVRRRRDTREHVGLYLTAFNAWATGEQLTRLRFSARDAMPDVAKL